jgi:hypothetical protein
MSVVPLTRNLAPVGVLLGGTGLARVPALRPVVVAALLRPWPRTLWCLAGVKVPCVVAR